MQQTDYVLSPRSNFIQILSLLELKDRLKSKIFKNAIFFKDVIFIKEKWHMEI